MDQEQTNIIGTVAVVIYFNAETLYTVMQVEPEKMILGYPLVTMTGIMPEIVEGELINASGSWMRHPKYGKQFQVLQVQRIMPISREGIIGYLKSGKIRGVGPKLAEQITDYFGENTLTVLDSDNALERLQEIPKIGHKTAEKILKAWWRHRSSANVLMFFQQFGISIKLASRIYYYYLEKDMDAIRVVRENPYQLTFDIKGVGFKTADRLARNMGVPSDSPFRIQAAISHVLDEATNSNGHVYLPVDELNQGVEGLIGMDARPELLADGISALAAQNIVHLQELPHLQTRNPYVGVYKSAPYYAEVGAAKRVTKLNQTPINALSYFHTYTDHDWFELLEQTTNPLTLLQKKAIRTSLTHRITILTGGPGTGKTTTLKQLISILEDHDISYALAAPTGRAAKRMNQATERPTQTLHRLLGYTHLHGFTYNRTYTLGEDFIVVDEASMLDIFLFNALMQAAHNDTHLLLVGDVDQLPSVGAGDVLHDLIRSGVCPIIRLDQIFRQGEGSLITQNAHLVNQGRMPELQNEGEDFFFFSQDDPVAAAELLVDIVENRIPNKFGFVGPNDIQVLSPMYRSPVGVEALNNALQFSLNPPSPTKKQLYSEPYYFREGDKVMQLKNNYDKNVFNGDLGQIIEITSSHNCIILIDDVEVEYDNEAMQQITLAYACSVHRSQGGEYPVVVMPILTQHYMLLQRNLLYTAITRARKLVVLVGSREAVQIAVRNDRVMRRWTALDWRLQQLNSQ